jgi:hypothetical protein
MHKTANSGDLESLSAAVLAIEGQALQDTGSAPPPAGQCFPGRPM